MANFFAELQALSVMESDAILDTRKKCNKIVEFFKQRPAYKDEVDTFAKIVRGLEPQTFYDADAFMVQDVLMTDLPEELRHDSLGFCVNGHLLYDGRFVYPVKDVHGDVMGWCGYDKFEDVKYLDSRTNGYKAKQGALYGMERLRDYYESKDPVYIVEGLVCSLYLRQEGLQSLATMGSYLTPYVIEIIKRFGNRAIIIPDSDEAGNKYRSQVRRVLSGVRVVQSTIAKDVDDSRQINPDVANELRKFKNPFYMSNLFR